MRRLTNKEKDMYLNAVTEQLLFKREDDDGKKQPIKDWKELTYGERHTLYINLITRRVSENITDGQIHQFKKYIFGGN
jgi:hypothetical protein